MKVKHWMSKNVASTSPKTSLLAARAMMDQLQVRQLPVLHQGRLVGILTDRDLRGALPSIFEVHPSERRLRAHRLHDVHVEDVMSVGPITAPPELHLREACRLMLKHKIGALPVLEGQRLVGIITRSDMLSAMMHYSIDMELWGQDNTLDILPDDALLGVLEAVGR
jgi:acetoin utilization protein AcuB